MDLNRSPLFNPEIISGWRPAAGISVHWTVDGLINLFAHPALGLTLSAASVMILLHYKMLGRPQAGGMIIPFLMLAAACLFGALVYGMAIDPKPRMFMAVTAIASTCFGVLAAHSWRTEKRLLVFVTTIVIAAKGAIATQTAISLTEIEYVVPRWIESGPEDLSVHDWTARALTLVPESHALPRHPAKDMDHVLMVGQDDCAVSAERAGLANWQPVRTEKFRHDEFRAITFLRNQQLFFGTKVTPVLCIFRRSR